MFEIVVTVGIVVVIVDVVVVEIVDFVVEVVVVDIVVEIKVVVVLFTMKIVKVFSSVTFSFLFIASSNSTTSSKILAEVSAKRKNNPWNFIFSNKIAIERI